MSQKSNINWLAIVGLLLLIILIIMGFRIVGLSFNLGPISVDMARPTPTNISPIEPTQVVNVPNPQPTTEPQPNSYIPNGIENPSGIVPSSATIISDDYVLNFVSVTPNPTFSDFLRVKLVVTNYSSSPRIFRFIRNSVLMRDDTGRTYPNDNPSDEIFRSVQVEMPIQEPVEFLSTLGHDWDNTTLLSFWGPIPASATKLYIDFNGFGPFSGFTMEIDL